jgi:hypothetical protein
MARRIIDFLVWVALALLLIWLGGFYPPIAAHVVKPVLIAACLVIFALAVFGFMSRKNPLEVLQGMTLEGYLRSCALVAGAFVWGFLTARVLGLGQHLLGAFIVAIPCLGLLLSAGTIAILTFYRDLGLGSERPKAGAKKKKKRRAGARAT